MENVETTRLTSIGGSFCLIDHDGHNVSDETYRGRLTGSLEQIDRIKKAYRVFAQRVDDLAGKGEYAIPHTAITYVVDPHGRFVSHFADALSAEEIATRLRLLLKSDKAGGLKSA